MYVEVIAPLMVNSPPDTVITVLWVSGSSRATHTRLKNDIILYISWGRGRGSGRGGRSVVLHRTGRSEFENFLVAPIDGVDELLSSFLEFGLVDFEGPFWLEILPGNSVGVAIADSLDGAAIGARFFLLVVAHVADVELVRLHVHRILFHRRFEVHPLLQHHVVLGGACLVVLVDELVELFEQKLNFVLRLLIHLSRPLHSIYISHSL
jgi:hypothetical protein